MHMHDGCVSWDACDWAIRFSDMWHHFTELPNSASTTVLPAGGGNKFIIKMLKSSKCFREELNEKKTPWFSLISSKNILKTKNTWFGWSGTLSLTTLIKLTQAIFKLNTYKLCSLYLNESNWSNMHLHLIHSIQIVLIVLKVIYFNCVCWT